MNKSYPVVLYPNQILRFLATNSALGISNSQPTANSPIQSKKKFNIGWFSLTKWELLGAIAVGVIIAWSLAFLSPFWLVASVWVVILLGIICNDSLTTKKQPATKQKITPSLENITLKSHQIKMPIQSTKLNKILDGVVMPSVGMSSARTGVSEKAFKQVLQQIFPNIQQGLSFHNPDLSIPYSADFAFIHSCGLSIDIEIDEPYVGNTKEPHHCTDNGKDDIRNQFFLKGNWTVIRFSEKQVVLYPKSCCKVIASVIARVTGDRTYFAQLLSIPDLPPDPMWTTREAKRWAKENYRQTYLPIGRKK
ncbi:PDDEXK family nuclease [Aerosakkonema funiforme]|uniref:DUF559 domain-containing protein n=1 Tax=Aerosakkonema funiforme FACHB-1375 TaxID=2949571 RepID=A0A926VBW0_9CYAN|nr:hypothetical protein [Aerosakkonema funiforme]MBD2181009.1 hypothetical protein [Aerosakkonema funiforme FACHB-1375]